MRYKYEYARISSSHFLDLNIISNVDFKKLYTYILNSLQFNSGVTIAVSILLLKTITNI